jgi:SAM-dependent methyltransferase
MGQTGQPIGLRRDAWKPDIVMSRNVNREQVPDREVGKFMYISPNNPLNAVKSRYSGRARERMFRLFMEKMAPTSKTLILDLGVTADEGLAESNYFERLYPFKECLVAAGLENASFLEKTYPGLRFVQISPGPLPFEDNHFDIVFCSAVLEHVGVRDTQRQFIAETLRVAKRFFFTTPNRFFPIEFHTFVPFAHWLPQPMHQSVLRALGMDFWASTDNLNLFTPGALGDLFPPSASVTIESLRLFGWPSNILAYGDKIISK